MDIYSFSLLCLWLFFGVDSSTTMPLPSATTRNDSQIHSFEFDGQCQEGKLTSFLGKVINTIGC